MRITPERRKLLEKAVKNDRILEMTDAFRIYSSKDSAKQSVKALESHGYLENIEHGKFKVVKIPESLKHLEKEQYGPKDYLGVILRKVRERIERG